jgi:DNA processing protein
MEENGLIIAELSIGSKPLAINFPQRNRIISGLSIATIVIEASLKSGSLITARFALEQNREIFAVPGFPLDPRCAGTNKLIKEGAHMVETIDDILENLPQNNSIKEHNINELKLSSYNIEYRNINMNYDITDKMRNEIKILLSSVPVDIDLLILQTKFPISVVTTIILELELAGKIQRIGGNKVVLLYE